MMYRKIWIPLLSLGIVALVVAGLIFVRPLTIANASVSPSADQAVPNSPAVTGTYYWSYAAKFVCGYQSPTPPAGTQLVGEPVVKPGNYATEINIQNPNFKLVPLIKRIIVLVDGNVVIREPQTVGPSGSAAIELNGDFSTLDDCNGLWAIIHPQLPLPTPVMPLFIGYLVILSPLDLNVNAVYTANAPGVAGSQPTGISINVLTVTGKRVFLPAGVNP
jgi:hypothetical protein